MALNLPGPVKVIINESGVYVDCGNGALRSVSDSNVIIQKARSKKEISRYEDFYEHLWDNYGLRNEGE